MNRTKLIWTLVIVGILTTAFIWSNKKHGTNETDSSPESRGEVVGTKDHRTATIHESDPDTRTNATDRMGSAKPTRQDQLLVLERAIASQEAIVEEKRAALAKFVRTNAVPYSKKDSPEVTVLDEETIKQAKKCGNQVGGYVDLKRAYEVEAQNLERLNEAKLNE